MFELRNSIVRDALHSAAARAEQIFSRKLCEPSE